MAAQLAQQKIAFIGGGSMAEAIIKGLLDRGQTTVGNLFVLQRSVRPVLQSVVTEPAIVPVVEPAAKVAAVRQANIVVLAVKPKDVAAAIAELREGFRPGQLLISVVAGMSTATLARKLDLAFALPTVRTMPNTSSAVGLSATGVAFTADVSAEQQALALDLVRAIGQVEVVAEPLLDLVTGVSGSGPAYVYAMMEAMIQAGIDGGLDAAAAKRLTVQTFLGAATMVHTTDENPADLRVKVTSPNGTTQAALEYLAEHGFADAVKGAVHRATARAKEIGEALAQE
jgi:pyrroline-5-carboxylate reductase